MEGRVPRREGEIKKFIHYGLYLYISQLLLDKVF